MIVNPHVDGCTKILNQPKILYSEKRKKKQKPTENQKKNKYRNTGQVRARFLHLACQGAVRTPVPVSYATEHMTYFAARQVDAWFVVWLVL